MKGNILHGVHVCVYDDGKEEEKKYSGGMKNRFKKCLTKNFEI